MQNWKRILKKVWYFIWEDSSIWSWIVNVVLAFVIIKFLVYPGLGFLLNTSHPVVAVVSESMEHKEGFEQWWQKANEKRISKSQIFENWYISNGITKDDFDRFPFKNGFNKGDIMALKGRNPSDIEVGSIIVFWSAKKDPIIHRVVRKWQENGIYYFQTKGDNYETNPTSIKDVSLDETRVPEDSIVGSAVFRIPFLGYIKIWFVDLLNFLKGIFS